LHGAVGDIVATGAPLIDFDSGTVVGSMPPTSEEEFVESVTLGRTRGNGNGNGNGIGIANGNGDARHRAVPMARALARRFGLDLTSIAGSGPKGLIKLDDVLIHAQGTTVPGLQRPDASALTVPSDATAEPLRGARRAMAHSMSLSRDQIPLSTVCDDADINAWPQRGDYTLRLIRAMIRAWRAEPSLNAWYDSASNSRILLKHIDLAIAVDTPGGLIVPVLRNIQDKSPEEIKAAIFQQKTAAHQRSLTPEDLRDFTLMLSNFGTLAGRYGIPIVVPPAVAILGAGKVRQDAVVVGGAVVAHRRMPLSLSFDHRCITGGEACRFLAAVIGDLERPD